MGKNSKFGICLVVVEIVLLFFYCSTLIKHNDDKNIIIASDEISYAAESDQNGESVRVSEGANILGAQDTGTNRRLVVGDIHLFPGLYQVDTAYDTDIPIGSTIGANISAYDKAENSRIKSESVFLSAKDNNARFYIYVYDEADIVIRLIMDDENTANISVNQIMVSRQPLKSVLPTLFYMLVVFGLIDGIYYCFLYRGDEIRKHKLVIFSVVVTALLSSIPLCAGSLLKGYDMRFHFYRVYALAEGLRSGQFPVYVYPEYANGYGYAVGIFYPDTFLYIPAILYLIGVRMEVAYMFFMFFINIFTVFISYYSFKKIGKTTNSGIVGMVIYTMALPRLVALYTRGALGAAMAYVFAPLLALGLIEMIRGNDKEERFSWIHVTLGMSGIISSHLLGSIMAVFFSVIFALINSKQFFKKNIILNVLKSILATALISASFIVPFLSGMLQNDIDSKANATTIADYAAFSAQIFSNGFNIIGDVWEDPVGMLNDMPMSLGVATLIMIVFIIALAVLDYVNYKNSILKKTGVIFVIAIWMSSTLFPYKWMSFHMKSIYGFLTKFQFAYRFLAVASLAAAVIATVTCEEIIRDKNIKKIFMAAIVAAFMLQGIDVLDDYTDEMVPFEYSESYRNLDVSALYTGEYLPHDFDANDISENVDCSELESSGGYFEITNQKGTTIEGDVFNPSDTDAEVVMPRAYYQGYVALIGDDKLIVRSSENGKVRVLVPSGVKGKVKLKYKPQLLWLLSSLISLIAVVILIGSYLKSEFCKKRNKNRLSKVR
ncbi:hypothetical protein [Butyrivibrio sp. AE3004]|uniref:hypothetical protein n=1 Tax=Butyrivibrio sp. AE3004 TaxID=1506994 RepID=UPI0004945A16|nr:hypothetical protein [Butyrivibrio sp. AE3004]